MIPRLRWSVAALAVAALAACGTSTVPGTDTTSTSSRLPAHVHVAARIGSATQLVADVTPRHALPSVAGPIATAEQAFSVSLLKQLGTGTDNLTVSPASLAIALSMLENGTAGTTRQQLADALHVGSVALPDQNAGWQALVDAWSQAAASDGFQLHSANAVWTQQGFPVNESYLAALRYGYGAGVWQVDFAKQAALAAIDAWCKQQTNGRITKLFDQLDPSTVAVLANAVYFKADWTSPFDSQQTSDAPFTTASGSTSSVPTMHNSQAAVPAAVTPDYEAVQLPYKGDRFAALAIMPTKQSLAGFVRGLTAGELQHVVASLAQGEVDLTMPKFTTSSTTDLVDTLKQLGVHAAFAGGDFSPMSPAPGLAVSDVLQRDYLAVTEKGTEAAAVTGIGIASSAVTQEQTVHLDHPFLFLVRDTQTGAILFASAVNDPSAG